MIPFDNSLVGVQEVNKRKKEATKIQRQIQRNPKTKARMKKVLAGTRNRTSKLVHRDSRHPLPESKRRLVLNVGQ